VGPQGWRWPDSMPYPNEHSCRLAAPGGGPFRRKQNAAQVDGRWVDHIYQQKGDGLELQAVRFRREEGWGGEAATRQARAWCKAKGGEFEPMAEETSAGHADGMAVSLYVQTPIGVKVEERGAGETYLVGLPLLRTGRWNGVEYDAERLRALVRNHRLIAEREAVTPALKSRHTYANGRPENVDAAEITLGWIVDLSYDEETGVLLGEVHVVQPGMLEDIAEGRLRYVSAEIVPNYVTADGDEVGPALVGAAWVDWPAVRGLPWEIVINREEWTDLARGDGGDTPSAGSCRDGSTMNGGDGMSTWSRFVDVLAGLFAGREKVEALDEFRDLDPAGGMSTGEESGDDKAETEVLAESETRSGPKGVPTEEVELLRQAHREAEARIAELERAYRTAQVEALVDKLVAAGAVRPATRSDVGALLDLLLQSDREVQVLRADGETESVKAVEVLVRILRDTAPKLAGGPTGRAYPGLAEDDEKPRVYSDEELARLVELANK